MKPAVMLLATSMVTVQLRNVWPAHASAPGPDPESRERFLPPKLEPSAGTAVSVTKVPGTYDSSHLAAADAQSADRAGAACGDVDDGEVPRGGGEPGRSDVETPSPDGVGISRRGSFPPGEFPAGVRAPTQYSNRKSPAAGAPRQALNAS